MREGKKQREGNQGGKPDLSEGSEIEARERFSCILARSLRAFMVKPPLFVRRETADVAPSGRKDPRCYCSVRVLTVTYVFTVLSPPASFEGAHVPTVVALASIASYISGRDESRAGGLKPTSRGRPLYGESIIMNHKMTGAARPSLGL